MNPRCARIALALVAITLSGVVFAAPGRGRVVRGDVTFIQRGNRLIIRASNGAIIEYANFNIAANQTVRFRQPGRNARVLNRITGAMPTVIEGRLLSNGQVYLVNPSGIVFTESAVINTGGIHAAAGSLSNADFTRGINHFTDLSGNVINEGTIRADRVTLVGDRVANHGSIRSDRGLVVMVAGEDVLIRERGSRIHVRVDGEHLLNRSHPAGGETTPNMTATPGVENTGDIRVNRGHAVLGAGDHYALAIRNVGSLGGRKARVQMAAADGLIHNQGAIDASTVAGRAGDITVQGPSVLNDGVIAANSEHGRGGQVEVTSSNHTFLRDGSEISAAGGVGNARGGNVLVHSYDGHTAMAEGATVDVSGGEQGGDGGFAEVSGLDLTFNGFVDLGAMLEYRPGTLLLDPHTIYIEEVGSDDSFLDDSTISFDEAGPDEDIVISASAFSDIVGFIHLQATGFILVNAPIVLEHNNDLLFEAHHAVSIREPIIGARNFTARGDVDGNGYGWVSLNIPLTFAGNVEFSGTDVVVNAGSITTGGTQTYNGRFQNGADNLLTASGVLINGTVDSRFYLTPNPNQRLTIDAPVTITGAIGATSRLRSIELRQTAHLEGGKAITNEFQSYLGDVTLSGDFEFKSVEAGDITFAAGLDGESRVSVTTAGVTRFEGPVGQRTPLRRLFTDAAGSTRIAGGVNAGTMDFNDPVALDGNVLLEAAQEVDFAATLQGNGHDLTIVAPITRFNGEATGLRVLRTDADGTTFIGDDMEGAAFSFGDVVELIGPSVITSLAFINFDGTVDGPHPLSLITEGHLRLGDDVGANVALAALTTRYGGVVLIDGSVIRATGDIQFNIAGRDEVPDVATIGARGPLSIVSERGDVTIGLREKLTALGSLLIAATEGTATFGDLNALGDITVIAEEIRVLTRESGDLLNFDGQQLGDDGVDIVALGTIYFSVDPIAVGDGTPPEYLSGDGSGLNTGPMALAATAFDGGFGPQNFTLGEGLDGTQLSNLIQTIIILNLLGFDVSPESLSLVSPLLDLAFIAGGGGDDPTNPNDPTGLAEVIPRPSGRLRDKTPLDPYALRPLERLGIHMRAMTDAELVDTTTGREFYDDTAPSRLAAGDNPTTANRLRRQSVIDVVERYAAIMEPAGSVDPNADAQSEHIRTTLASAWEAYSGDDRGGPSANADGFCDYLHLSDNEEAALYIAGLRALHKDLWIMGATPLELHTCMTTILTPICPEGMSIHVLEEAVSGES